MNVVVNAASAHMGGSVTYIKNVLRYLPELAPHDRFTVYLPATTLRRLREYHRPPVVRLRPYPFRRTAGATRMLFDQVVLPWVAHRDRAELIFSTTGFGSWMSRTPELLLLPNIAYFDPRFHQRYRELGRSLRRNTLRRRLALASVRFADGLLLPTAAMKAAVEHHLSLDGRQVDVMHFGFDPGALRASIDREAPWVRTLESWRASGYAILLNVSTYAVQKSLETLVEAMSELRRTGVLVKLVTTTSAEQTTDTAEYAILQDRARELGVREDWIELGYVDADHLRSLYENADVYVFPSFSESFGFSLVEAMALGLPVAAADTAVTRDVCDDAAMFFTPFDAAGCAAVVRRLLGGGEAARLREAATRRAEHFDWRRYVEDLTAVFRKTAGQESRDRTDATLREGDDR